MTLKLVKIYLPRMTAGMVDSTKTINKILVDFFIVIFSAKFKNVYINFSHIAHPLCREEKMDEKELLTNYINAVYQNTKTAIQSIEDIITKVEDDGFKKELATEQDGYYTLCKEIEMLAKAEGIEGIKDNNWLEKARLWTSVNMSTITDKSNRKIAELMLIGTFMGYITCIKDLADHKNISKDIDEIIERLKNYEKSNLERLIPYLD